jgi:cell division septum initiation protein DivIVA
MLDNVKAEYESAQNIIKKLKEELDKLRTDNIYEE